MPIAVPQEILDALTDVKMPRISREAPDGSRTIVVQDWELPVWQVDSLIVGSGSAGLRAAVEYKRLGGNPLVISSSLFGGTSACSGSDKQTLHTAGTGNNGDNFNTLASDLGSGGCMDHDTAYIEATGSLGAFSGLQYMGLPLPQDRFGAVLRYQTDHDEVGRATSCGPRTSRLMVKVLAEEALRLGIPFVPNCEAIKLLTETQDDGSERCIGAMVLDRSNWQTPHHGMTVVLCSSVVLATGGPGELYRDSVYPKHCYGSLGMAIEAGCDVTNLTESQFGIGTRRQEFPWNLSGTYVQVIPYVYSVDADGNEHNFLAEYYRTTRELASNTFRKGYQWPFHATRMCDFKSSLLDLAVYRESQLGRTVYLDFLRNPQPGPDGKDFDLQDLDQDVYDYLANNEALQELPIDRLKQMNPLAIELYRMHGTDLSTEPLPFNVNNQHMNGGVAVDIWNQTSIAGCYAVGEVAGTHGVTRPGGAALNGGQVGGMRAARHMHERHLAAVSEINATTTEQIATAIAQAKQGLHPSDDQPSVPAVRAEVQSRMSDKAGFLCYIDEVSPAKAAAETLRQQVYQHGITAARPSQLAEVFRWQHLALASEAVLTALDHYVEQGGGSRGARAYLSSSSASKNASETAPSKRASQSTPLMDQ